MKSKKSRKAVKKGAVISKRPLPTANITERRIGEAKADVSGYVRAKTAAGHVSLNCGDSVAKSLAGKELPEIYKAVAKALKRPVSELQARYKHLNPGMQRMNLGNVLRGAQA